MTPLDLPDVGLGTMGIDDPDVIATAIELGYRHLDTARIYANEDVVGEGISLTDVPREELVVATKVWTDSLAHDDVRRTAEESLDRLGLTEVDLLYVHRPIGTYDPAESLPAFDALVEADLVDYIGLSNFTIPELEVARDHLEAPIGAHQVEFHPLFQPEGVLEHARDHGYPLVAYSPLAGGRVDEVEAVAAVADEHGTTPEAVSLAWIRSKEGVVAIPKANTRSHLEANLAAVDLALSDADVERIDGIERTEELFPE